MVHHSGKHPREVRRGILRGHPVGRRVDLLCVRREREQVSVVYAPRACGIGGREELEEDQVVAIDRADPERREPTLVHASA